MDASEYVIDAVKLCSFGKLSFTFKKGTHIQEYVVEREAVKPTKSPQGYCDEKSLIDQFQIKRIEFLTIALLNFKKKECSSSPVFITASMLEQTWP